MMASRQKHLVLPRENYITFPEKNATLDGSGILQHYVADSKPWYFGHAWRIARTTGAGRDLLELPS